MGLFDRIKGAFRGKQASTEQQVDQVPVEKAPEVSLSPLPKSINGMPKEKYIDRLGMMHASDIGFAPGFGPEQDKFWAYKEQRSNGHSKADYLEMASHIPEVRERLDNGESLESLMHDDRVGACAAQYFSPGNMIKVESYPDGHYEYVGGGRHRIAAAQELGIEIPVQVNEYGNKDGYAISPWEKQERYDALMDYMNEHGYSEADRAAYEADPEWQRLHREFDHPVNEWERAPLSDWETDVDALLEKRYQEMHGIPAKKEAVPETVSDASASFHDTPARPDAGKARRQIRTKPVAPPPATPPKPPKPPVKTPQSGGVQSVKPRDRYQSSYADRIRQTPSLESNRWAGERGESVCAPHSDAARRILEEHGIKGVQYQDGIPDFSPFSESTVKLGYMTDARHSQGLADGRDGKSTVYAHFEDGKLVSDANRADKSSLADLHMKYDKPGNFEQADALTAEQWTADGRDGKEWTAEDVAQYRQDHGLTWHECNDMETMQLIPEAINEDFGHLGGVGEVKEMSNNGDLKSFCFSSPSCYRSIILQQRRKCIPA